RREGSCDRAPKGPRPRRAVPSRGRAGSSFDPRKSKPRRGPGRRIERRQMPLVTAFNLRADDPLSEIEEALRQALTSMPELRINDFEVVLAPVLSPAGFHGTVTRINVDLWERPERTKEALQELAGRVALAFQAVAGRDRRVTVVIRPYDVEASGWVSL